MMLLKIDRFHADRELSRSNNIISYVGVDTVIRRVVRITRYVVPPGSSTQILKKLRNLRSPFISHVNAVHYDSKRSIFSIVEPAPCCTAQLLIDLSYSNSADSTILHEELIWEIASSVIEALDYLASYQIFHMGLRPEAIYLTEAGPQLAAPSPNLILSREDLHSMDLQTLPYMAPEVIAGRKYIQQSDIWSLGATLYTCTTGHPPTLFQVNDDVDSLLKSYFTMAYELAECLSSELASLIISLLAPLAGARPTIKQLRMHPRIRTTLERLAARASFTEQYLIAFLNLHTAETIRQTYGLAPYNLERVNNHLGFTALMRNALFPVSLQLGDRRDDLERTSEDSSPGSSFDSSLLGCYNVLGKTALLLAIETHNVPLIRLLFQYEGALVDYRGLGALAIALTCNFRTAVTAIQAYLTNSSSDSTSSALPQNSFTSQQTMATDEKGYTPLILAVLRNDIEGVWHNLDAYEGMRDTSGRTALFHSVENNFLAIARLLAAREVGLTSDFGNTALRLCAERNLLAMSVLCYKEAGILYATKPAPSTVSDVAIANRNYALASLLLKYDDVSLRQLDLPQCIYKRDIVGIFRGLHGHVISTLPLQPIIILLSEADLLGLLNMLTVHL